MASENEILAKVLERASTDVAFRQALKADPRKVLGEAGMQVPEGVTCNVIENSPDVMNIVLPELPPEEELGGEMLEARTTKSALFCVPGPGGAVTLMPICVES